MQTGTDSFPLTTAQRGIWTTQKIAPHANLNIAEAVEISGPVDPEIFRRALGQLVAEAEELRVGIVDRDGRPNQARHEWVTPFGTTEDPLARMVWIRGDGVHEWMLVAHHCICDGPSGMTLLRDCFAAYDDPQPEAGAYDSLRAIEDIVPEALMKNRSFRFRVRWRTALLKLALLVKPRRRPEAYRSVCSDEMYFHRWQLDPADAQTLIERCRKENATILAIAGAAFLQAFREIRGPAALKHAYAMVNARRFMPRLHPEALWGMAPGVAIPMPKMLPPAEISTSALWQNARAIRKNLEIRIGRLGKQFHEYLMALENFHDRYPRLIADTESASAVRTSRFPIWANWIYRNLSAAFTSSASIVRW